jgi:hypothetical protein
MPYLFYTTLHNGAFTTAGLLDYWMNEIALIHIALTTSGITAGLIN